MISKVRMLPILLACLTALAVTELGEIEVYAATGDIVQFSDGITSGSTPGDIIAGPDGNLWFLEESGNKIGKITPEGRVTEYPLPSQIRFPTRITVGSDGNAWFTGIGKTGSRDTAAIGRVVIGGSSEGQIAVTLASTMSGVNLGGITGGPDGNIWFTADFSRNSANRDQIGRLVPDGSGSGTITYFPVPVDRCCGNAQSDTLSDIKPGPDGNIWFTELDSAQIGTISPAGNVTETAANSGADGDSAITSLEANNTMWSVGSSGVNRHSVPLTNSSTGIGTSPGWDGTPRTFDGFDIVAGSDHNLWILHADLAISRLKTDGTVTEYTQAVDSSAWASVSEQIAAGPDGNIWFTNSAVDRVGRISVEPEPQLLEVKTETSSKDEVISETVSKQTTNTVNTNTVNTVTTSTDALKLKARLYRYVRNRFNTKKLYTPRVYVTSNRACTLKAGLKVEIFTNKKWFRVASLSKDASISGRGSGERAYLKFANKRARRVLLRIKKAKAVRARTSNVRCVDATTGEAKSLGAQSSSLRRTIKAPKRRQVASRRMQRDSR